MRALGGGPLAAVTALGLLAALAGCAGSGGAAGAPSAAPPVPSAGAPTSGAGAQAARPAEPPAGAEGTAGERSPGAAAGSTAPGTAAGQGTESAGAEGGGEEAGDSGSAGGGGEAAGAPPAGAARTAGERQEELDGELSASLSEFDRLLLRERERLARRAAATPPAGDSGGTGSGSEAGADDAESAGAGGGDDATSGESSDFAAGEEPVHRAEGPVEGEEEEGASDRVPRDVGRGDDDDIVARQLREAAMAEDDPELRARLWDEYRAYKGLPRRGPDAGAGAEEAGDG